MLTLKDKEELLSKLGQIRNSTLTILRVEYSLMLKNVITLLSKNLKDY